MFIKSCYKKLSVTRAISLEEIIGQFMQESNSVEALKLHDQYMILLLF